MKKQRSWEQKNIALEIIEILKKNELIISTTDTVIGLLASITIEGKEALDCIKQRSDKPYIILVDTVTKAARFAPLVLHTRLQSLVRACWPGPVTIIMPAGEQVPPYVTSRANTVALRIPDHEQLQKVLASFDGLFSTSANLTGEPIPSSLDQVHPDLLDKVTLLVGDRHSTTSTPSTIIDCTGAKIKIVREGAYSKDIIKQYVDSIENKPPQ